MDPRFAPAIEATDDAIRHSISFREWLRSRRWLGDSVGVRAEIAVKDRAELATTGTQSLVLFIAVAPQPEGDLVIHLPLSISRARMDPGSHELSVGSDRVYVSEAEAQEAYLRWVVENLERNAKIPTKAGDSLRFQGEAPGTFRSMGPPLAGDSTNLLVRFSTARYDAVFKSYKLPDVRNREPEILERLHRKQFRHVPRYLGELALGSGPGRLVLAVATEFVDSADLFTWMTRGWQEEFAHGSAGAGETLEQSTLDVAASLGEATAGLHEALFDRHPGSWQAETFRGEDATAARRAAITNLGESLRRLAILSKGGEPHAAELAAKAREFLFDSRGDVESILRGLDANLGTPKMVIHGDLHLGQVLRRNADGGLMFIDFEGEPERTRGQRSWRLPPLRDVATMNRSFSYVKHYAWRESVRGDATAAMRLLMADALTDSESATARRLLAWEAATTDVFTKRYLSRSSLYEGMRPDEALQAVHGWMMEKALYEFRYELKFRPQNIFIPLEGIMTLATPRDR